jgi:hypothetical protein
VGRVLPVSPGARGSPGPQLTRLVRIRPMMSINPIVGFINPSNLLYLIDAGTEIKVPRKF